MPSDRNINQGEVIKAEMASSNFVISTGFSGITVKDMTSLRKALRTNGASYKVVKNTLAAIAADELGRPEIKEILTSDNEFYENGKFLRTKYEKFLITQGFTPSEYEKNISG